MPHHVALVELHEADAFHALEDFHGVNQAAAAAGGQVDLRHVAIHHHLGVETLAGNHHLHLFAGGVLGLVEDDEAIVERAPAHKREGRHLNHVSFQQFFHPLVVEHLIEGIVQGTQVGVHFFLQRAGQKSQAFAGFHGRPGQNDARHLFAQQCGNGHGDGQVRLAGAGGSDAEYQIVALHGFQVPPLVDGLRRQDLLAETALFAAVHQGAQGHFRIESHHAQIAVQVAVIEDVAFAHEGVVILQDGFRARDVGCFAFDFQAVIDQLGVDG